MCPCPLSLGERTELQRWAIKGLYSVSSTSKANIIWICIQARTRDQTAPVRKLSVQRIKVLFFKYSDTARQG